MDPAVRSLEIVLDSLGGHEIHSIEHQVVRTGLRFLVGVVGFGSLLKMLQGELDTDLVFEVVIDGLVEQSLSLRDGLPLHLLAHLDGSSDEFEGGASHQCLIQDNLAPTCLELAFELKLLFGLVWDRDGVLVCTDLTGHYFLHDCFHVVIVASRVPVCI